MQTAKNRVNEELAYLTEKRTKLQEWLFSPAFYALSQEQQDLLCIQYKTMETLILNSHAD